MDHALAWKRVLLSVCGCTFILACIIGYQFYALEATTGLTFTPAQRAFVDRIAVRVGSPAFASGLRTGDFVDLRLLPPAQRFRMSNYRYFPGEVLRVPVEQNGSVRWFTVAAQHRQLPWAVWFGLAGTLWTLLFATIISARRADHAEARILASLLVSFALSLGLAPNNLLTPWPAFEAAAAVASTIFGAISTALLATYAMRFARPAGTLRRTLEWLTYLAAAISAMFGIAGIFGTWAGTIDVNAPEYTNAAVQFANSVLPPLLPLACMFLAIGASRGAERTRVAWAGGSLAILYIGNIVYVIMAIVDPVNISLANIIGNITLFAAPVGLTYSLLSRRLLDVGFALNRAAMFATTTLLLAGLFAGLQWVANQTLSSYAHATSAGVQLLIAIVVYYVVRLSRDRTDALVSSLFFAKRQRRLAALSELANAVDEVHDPEEIGPVVVAFLRARASIDAIVFLQNASNDFAPAPGSPDGVATIGKDNLLAVTLRTRRSPTPLTNESDIDGFAFPMLIRARLRGVLVCRAPRDDNEFAPDEIDALFVLASRMASARDDLLSQSLRDQLQAIQARNPTLAHIDHRS
jgi:hypothetical protein